MAKTDKDNHIYNDYHEYAFSRDIIYFRPVIVLCIILYGLFGIMDFFLYGEYIQSFFIIRYAIVIPLFIMALLLSYTSMFRRFYQYILLGIFIAGGLGIIAMISMIEGPNYYYGGLYLVFSVAFFLLRLRSIYATIGTIILLLSLLFVGVLYGKMTTLDLIVELVFYSGFTIIAIFGSKYIEQYRLNQYFQESNIIGEKIVLEKEVFQQYENIRNAHKTTILAMARLAEARDTFTSGHIYRVGYLSLLLARSIPDEYYKKNNVAKEDILDSIELASSLHDIGKIAISDIVLNKPGKLSQKEFEIIKTHTTIGFDMLNSIEEELENNVFISLGKNITKSHHERWDGTGYPEGLKKQEIPIEARIVSIIDVYDALISKRPYKNAFSKDKSLAIICDGIGSHFDPYIADLFLSLAESSTSHQMFGQ
jgi:response regulator RpfG family c-di-GMP phosphodiesterase